MQAYILKVTNRTIAATINQHKKLVLFKKTQKKLACFLCNITNDKYLSKKSSVNDKVCNVKAILLTKKKFIAKKNKISDLKLGFLGVFKKTHRT